MSSKIRLVLAGLTAAALIGGVMVADPADAGKKKKHKKAKVVKVHKNKVKQVSKGGDAKAGNGGNGGAGGSSGNVNNTGNVVGGPAAAPGPGAGLPVEFVACINAVLAQFGNITPVELDECATPPGLDAFPAFTACLGEPTVIGSLPGGGFFVGWDDALVESCLVGAGGPAGDGVFSGGGGAGGNGGFGGNAIGGTGGNNTNTSTVTVTRDDHSIDVG